MSRQMPVPPQHYGGMTFDPGTPAPLMQAIIDAAQMRARMHISYGCPDSGLDALSEFEAFGRIGWSTGPMPIPLVIHNERSRGGGALQTNRIVRLHSYNHLWWEHPTYYFGRIEIRQLPGTDFILDEHGVCTVGKTYNVQVVRDDEEYRRFQYLSQAVAWCKRMGVDAYVMSVNHRACRPVQGPRPLTRCNIPDWR